MFNHQAQVVQTLDNAIHRINHYPVDSIIDFCNTYPLDSDLFGGKRYPTFEQPGPGLHLDLKHKKVRDFFASSEKKAFNCARARHDEYCAITLSYCAEIRIVDSQFIVMIKMEIRSLFCHG